MLEIYFLDGPTLHWQGNPLPGPSRHDGSRLLVCLLLGTIANGTRENIAALLWPDEEDAVARTRLRQALHSLRQALPADAPEQPWILASRREIVWNSASDFRLDLHEIMALAAGVQAGGPDARPKVPGNLSRSILGDPKRLLPSMDEAWLMPWRNQLEVARNLLREGLIESLAGSGALDEALAGARVWSRESPLDEAAHRWLMRLQLAMGDRAAALNQYDLCRDLLETELSLPPSAETEAVRTRILEASAGPKSPEGPPDRIAEAGPSWGTSLPSVSPVDRQGRREAATLSLRAGSLLSLVGPGGQGKSRLAAELAQRWLERGRTVFAFAGDEMPASREGTAPASGPILARSRSALFDCEAGLTGIFARLADPDAPRGALWLLDDVDPCLSEAAGAARWIRQQDPSARVLATARQPLRAQGETVLPLAALDLPAGGEAETLLLQLAVAVGSRAPAGEALRRLCRATGGNPLSLSLVALSLGSTPAERLIECLESGSDLDCGLAIEPQRHRSLRHSIAWGHALLSDAAKGMLARMFAHPAPLNLVEVAALAPAVRDSDGSKARAGQANPAETLASLAELVRSGFVEVTRGTTGQESRYQPAPGLAALLAGEPGAN
jgi:DNA-binding SARP family transcriptional activator